MQIVGKVTQCEDVLTAGSGAHEIGENCFLPVVNGYPNDLYAWSCVCVVCVCVRACVRVRACPKAQDHHEPDL